MKTCFKCQTAKPLDDFAKNKTRKDGRQAQCRKCKQAYQREHYQKNKKQYYDYHRQHRQTNREFIARYLADKQCEECGFADVRALDFDHINPCAKYLDISIMLNQCYSIHAIEDEIKKCRILCANCHRIHTATQQGWFDKEAFVS